VVINDNIFHFSHADVLFFGLGQLQCLGITNFVVAKKNPSYFSIRDFQFHLTRQ
jgi:hypothetical protein